ncbi:MAG: type VI secretion system tube protein Hcp, partial [Verrucomicrobiaceae bacterium]
GKSKASALTISKRLDRTSPLLFLGCASGIIYPTVNLELARTDSSGTSVTYYKINLSNVLVTSMETSSGGERPTEKVALSYERIVTEYYIQDSKGVTSTSPTSTSVWNFATNSAK